MKFTKWIAILLIVLLSGFFLISSEEGADKNKEKNKYKVRVQCVQKEDWDFDFLDDLEINLKGLDKKIEKMVKANLEGLKISVDLEGLQESLKSLKSLEFLKDLKVKIKDIAEMECARALEDLEAFFEDFDWDFDINWNCGKKYKKKKYNSTSKNKEKI